jgi:hypothetical protein
MIRIHLLERQDLQIIAILIRLFLVVGSVALLVSAIYLVDRQFPILQLWREVSASLLQAEDEEEMSDAATGSMGDLENYAAAASGGETRSHASAQPAAATARATAAASLVQQTVPVASRQAITTAAPDLRPLPKSSRACAIAIGLLRHAPDGARITSLMGRGDGKYTIEGSGISQPLAERWRDQMLEESANVRLTVWTLGTPKTSSERRFSYTGMLKHSSPSDLVPVAPEKSVSVLREVSSWARASGIRSLTVEGPIPVVLNKGLSKHRQKIWGKGSQAQVAAFAERLVEAGPQATLSELVIVPVYRTTRQWKDAHIYAVVDVLVR